MLDKEKLLDYPILIEEIKWSRQFIDELFTHLVGCHDFPPQRLEVLRKRWRNKYFIEVKDV